MGIKGLTGLLSEHAPDAIKHHEIKTLFGRKVAIDASMSIYQFLIAVRQKDGEVLMNDAGETTSHLMGFFYRTIRIVENGIKPAYVFDGRPPELKKGVLAKRFERREEAKEEGEEAKEVGTTADVDRFSRRTVKVTKEHNEECRRLLRLMGIPVVIAPSEAEAQCAELARGGKVFAAGSEDMDTLTFSAPILFRHLTFSEAKKQPISEINLKIALEGLDMNMSQFIELCILLGCDYLEPIRGVGPKSALKLIREHGSLKEVVKHLRAKAAERAALPQPDSEGEEVLVPSDDDEPPPTSDFERPDEDDVDMSDADHDRDSDKDNANASDDDDEDEDDEERAEKRKVKAKAKADKVKAEKEKADKKAKAKSKKTKKANGGAGTSKGGKTGKSKGTGRGGPQIPEDWPWEKAKELFEKPDVTPADQIELEWKNPDVDGLVEFLVKEKGFNEERVRAGAAKLTKYMNSKQQGRLDGFFTVKPKDKVPEKKDANAKGKAKGKDGKDVKGKAVKGAGGAKRKADEEKASTSKKTKRK